MKIEKMTPEGRLKSLVEIFSLLYEENKAGNYKDKFEAYNHVLTDMIIAQSYTLISLYKKGIEVEIENEKINVYDTKSGVNIFRGLVESYITWSNIYCVPSSNSIKRAKFILWTLEGLKSINQFSIKPELVDIFDNLITDESQEKLELELNENDFFKSLSLTNKEKLIKKDQNNSKKVKAYHWRFSYISEKRKLKIYSNILPYIKDKLGDFQHDLYKFSSFYVHSSYASANQTYLNDKRLIGTIRTLNSLIHQNFNILCLCIRDILIQNKNLMVIFNAQMEANSLIKVQYYSTLKWFKLKTE